MPVRRSVGVGEVVTRHADTEKDVLKLHCAVVALRLQLKYRSQRPIRVSIIHVRDFMGFSRILLPMLTANFFYLHAACNKIRLGLDCGLISAGENGELMVVFVTEESLSGFGCTEGPRAVLLSLPA